MKLAAGILAGWAGAAILLAVVINRALKSLRQLDDDAMRAFADTIHVNPDPEFIRRLLGDMDLWEEQLAEKDDQ